MVQFSQRLPGITNPRRVVTGFFFGYALCALFLLLNISGFRFGYSLVT